MRGDVDQERRVELVEAVTVRDGVLALALLGRLALVQREDGLCDCQVADLEQMLNRLFIRALHTQPGCRSMSFRLRAASPLDRNRH